MSHLFFGKIFIRGGHKIPKNSYLVFIYQGDYAVYKTESIRHIPKKNEFTIDGSQVEDCSIDPHFLELRIGNILVNNVRWFYVEETLGDKLKITPKKIDQSIFLKDYVLSILTFGILGCVFLKNKNDDLHKIADSWYKTQKELCELYESRTVDGILETASDVEAARSLKETYGDFQRVKEELKNAQKEVVPYPYIEALKRELEESNNKFYALEDRFKDLGEDNFSEAIRLKNKFGTFELLNKEIAELKFLKDHYGSLESIDNKLNNSIDIQIVNKLEEEYDSLRDRFEKANNQLQRIGTEEDLNSLLNLRDNYGSFELIRQKLEIIPQLQITVDRQEVTLQKWHEEFPNIERAKHTCGSWENLFEAIDAYKEISSHLNEKDIDEVIKLKDNYGNINKLRKEIENFQSLKDTFGSLETITNKLTNYIDHQIVKKLEEENNELKGILESEEIVSLINFRKNCSEDLEDLPHTIKDLRNIQERYGSLDTIREKLFKADRYQTIEDHIDLLGDQDLEEAVKLKKEYGSLGKLITEIQEFQTLKNNHGSFEHITYKLSRDIDPNYVQKLEESHSLLQEKYDSVISQLQRIGTEEEINTFIRLREKYGSPEIIQNKLEELQTLEKWKGDFLYIEQVKNHFNSWEKLLERVNKLKHLEDSDIDEAIRLKNDYGNFSKLTQEIEDFQILKDNFGSFEIITHKLNNGVDSQIVHRLEYENHHLKERLEKLQKWGSEEELPLFLNLKDHYGSLELIKQKLEKLEELPHLQNIVEKQKQELDKWQQESQYIEKAKNNYGSWDHLFQTLEDLKTTENKYQSLGETEFQEAISLKNNYGTLNNLDTEIKEYRSLKDHYGSLEAINTKLSNCINPQLFQKLEIENTHLHEQLDKTISKLHKLGTEEELIIIENLRIHHGSLDLIHHKLEEIPRLEKIIEQQTQELNTWEQESPNIEKAKNTFGSWSHLFEAIDAYKEIDHKVKQLGSPNLDQALTLKETYGNLEKLSKDAEEYKQLRDKYGSLETIIQNLEQLEDIPRFQNIIEKQQEELDRWRSESTNIERAKTSFGSWENLFEAIDTYKDLESKYKELGDSDFKEAISLKNEYGNLNKLGTELQNFLSLKYNYGSLETIINKLNTYLDPEITQRLEQEKTQLQDELEELGTKEERRSLLFLRRNYEGTIDELSHTIKNLINLQQTHGSLEEIKHKLLKAEYPLEKEEEIKENFGSWENLLLSADKYRDIEEQLETLGYSDLREALKLKEIYGTLSKLERDLEDYQYLKDRHGSLDTIVHNLQKLEEIPRLEQIVHKQQDELDKWHEDSTNIERVKDNFGSWNNLFEALENYKKLDLKFKNLGSLDFEEALKLKNEHGNLSKLGDEIQVFQSLKDNHGSLESIISRLINYIDPQVTHRLEQENKHLHDKFEKANAQLQRVISSEEEFSSLINLRKDFGSNYEDLSSSLHELRTLKDNHGSLDLINQKLERLCDIPRLEDVIVRQREELNRWQELFPNRRLETLEELKHWKEPKVELEEKVKSTLNNLSNNGTSNDVSWRSLEDSGKNNFIVFFNNKNQQLKAIVEYEWINQPHSEFKSFGIKRGKDKSETKLLEKLIKKLCKHYKREGAHLGIIVTNLSTGDLEQKGIQNISVQKPKEFKEHMNLLLVHESFFEGLLFIIRYVNNIFNPENNIVLTYAEKQAFFNDPRVVKFAKELSSGLIESEKRLSMIKAEIHNIKTFSDIAARDYKEYEDSLKKLHQNLREFVAESNYHTGQNLLDIGSVEVEDVFETATTDDGQGDQQ